MTVHILLFYFFAFIAVASAIGVITLRNTIHCAVSLLLTFFCVAALFVLLEAEFLAAVQLYIYAGAIMVLVVFVIMLVNVREDLPQPGQIPLNAVAVFVGIGIFFFLMFVIMAGDFSPPRGIYTAAYQAANGGQTKLIGKVLYTEYLFPFEIASVLLLVAMIGGIILPTRRRFRRNGKGKGEMV